MNLLGLAASAVDCQRRNLLSQGLVCHHLGKSHRNPLSQGPGLLCYNLGWHRSPKGSVSLSHGSLPGKEPNAASGNTQVKVSIGVVLPSISSRAQNCVLCSACALEGATPQSPGRAPGAEPFAPRL